jgi:hypothetical protein
MELKVNFISVEERLPEPYVHVLLWYKKGENVTRTGKTGNFLTEGYYDKKRDAWFDFTNRPIMKRSPKIKTSNNVFMWAKIPEDFVHFD